MYRLELILEGQTKKEILSKFTNILMEGPIEMMDKYIKEVKEEELPTLNDIAQARMEYNEINIIKKKCEKAINTMYGGKLADMTPMNIMDIVYNKNTATTHLIYSLVLSCLNDENSKNNIEFLYNKLWRDEDQIVPIELNETIKMFLIMNNDSYSILIKNEDELIKRTDMSFTVVIAIIELLSIATTILSEYAISDKEILEHIICDAIPDIRKIVSDVLNR